MVRTDGREQVVTLAGERIDLVGVGPGVESRLSLRGMFVDTRTFSVDAQHEHIGWYRASPPTWDSRWSPRCGCLPFDIKQILRIRLEALAHTHPIESTSKGRECCSLLPAREDAPQHSLEVLFYGLLRVEIEHASLAAKHGE